MITVVTYSTENYEKARKYSVKMAYKKGKADKVFEYSEECLSEGFKIKNRKTISCSRGAGYWVWKPYVVNKALGELEMGDYLFYCDSGAFLTKELYILVEFMEKEKTDILFFELPFIEKDWTKRDIFIDLDCDSEEYTHTKQRCATYFLLKKTVDVEKFIKEWLEYAQKYELISDEDNIIYKQPNYEGFRDNRHDQSILSVLSKKHSYKAYEDISQFRYPRNAKARLAKIRERIAYEKYPIMVCLHRQKKADCTTKLREHLLNYFPKLKRFVHYGYH